MHCLAHYQVRSCCKREDQILRYRYDLDELTQFRDKLQIQLDDYERWRDQVEYKILSNWMARKSKLMGPLGNVKIDDQIKLDDVTETDSNLINVKPSDATGEICLDTDGETNLEKDDKIVTNLVDTAIEAGKNYIFFP